MLSLWRFSDFTRLFRDLILIVKVKKIEDQGFSGKDSTRAGSQARSPDVQPVDLPWMAVLPSSEILIQLNSCWGKRSLLVTTFGQSTPQYASKGQAWYPMTHHHHDAP